MAAVQRIGVPQLEQATQVLLADSGRCAADTMPGGPDSVDSSNDCAPGDASVTSGLSTHEAAEQLEHCLAASTDDMSVKIDCIIPAPTVAASASDLAVAASRTAHLVTHSAVVDVVSDSANEVSPEQATSAALATSANVSDVDTTSDSSSRRMPGLSASLKADSEGAYAQASPGSSASMKAADLAKAREREEKVRLKRDIINREKQKKIDDLLEAQRLAQEYRRRQEEVRRQKIEEMRRKEEERQKLAEDRRLARDREDEERRNQLQQRKIERRQRLEEELAAARRRSSGRRSEPFGFGSRSPRFDDSLVAVATGKRSSSISNIFSSVRHGPSSGDSSDGGGEIYICPRFRDYHRRCLSAHAGALGSATSNVAIVTTSDSSPRATTATIPLNARQFSKSTSNLVGGGSKSGRSKFTAKLTAAASMLAVVEVSHSDADTSDSASLVSGRRARGDPTTTTTTSSRVPAEQQRQTGSPTSDGATSSLQQARAAVRQSRSVERRRRAPDSGATPASAGGRALAHVRAKSAPVRNRKSGDGQQPSPRTKVALSSSSSEEKSPRTRPKPAWIGDANSDDAAVEQQPSDNVVRILRSPPPVAALRTGGDVPKVTISEKTLERLSTPKSVKAGPLPVTASPTPAIKSSTTDLRASITAQTIERLATPKSIRSAGSPADAGEDAKPSGSGISAKTLERLAMPKRHHVEEESHAASSETAEVHTSAGSAVSIKTLERLAAPKRLHAEEERQPTVPEGAETRMSSASAISTKTLERLAMPKRLPAEEHQGEGDVRATAIGHANLNIIPEKPMRKKTKPAAQHQADKADGHAKDGGRDDKIAHDDATNASEPSAAHNEEISSLCAADAPTTVEPSININKRPSRPAKRTAVLPSVKLVTNEKSTTENSGEDGSKGIIEKHVPRRRPLSAKRAPKPVDSEDSEFNEDPQAKAEPRITKQHGMRKAKSVASVAAKAAPISDHHAKTGGANRRPESPLAAGKSRFPKSKSNDALKAAGGMPSAALPVHQTNTVSGGVVMSPKEGLSNGNEGDAAPLASSGGSEEKEGATSVVVDTAPSDVQSDDVQKGSDDRKASLTEGTDIVSAAGGSMEPADTTKAAPIDAYKTKLAEKRRQAREKADKEAEEERKKQDEQRRAEEEAERLQAEEERRLAEEEQHMVEQAAHAEEERLRLAIEEAEKRRREVAEAAEAERLAKEEMDRKLKEEAEKREKALREKIEREEAERLERKKKLEMIMKRVKTEPPSHELKKNDSTSALTSMADSVTNASAGMKPLSANVGKDMEDPSKFRSSLLNSLIAGRSKSDAALKSMCSDDSLGTGDSGDHTNLSSSLAASANGFNGACHDSNGKKELNEEVASTVSLGDGRVAAASAGSLSSGGALSSLLGNNNDPEGRQALLVGSHQRQVTCDNSSMSEMATVSIVIAGAPSASREPIEGAH